MQARPMDLTEVIPNVMKMIRRLLGEHIKVVLSSDSSSLWVNADSGMIDQVIMNLCINARDAMPYGGVISIETRSVELKAEVLAGDTEMQPGRFVCLSVKDSGCGMDAKTIKHIFAPFFTTKTASKGTGLGLATVYGIIKQHHGRITVESAPGAGTTFTVYLPAIKKPETVGNNETPLEVRGGTEGILLVEDEDVLRKKIVQSLRIRGYRVWEMESGPKALETWDSCRDFVSLLMTDMVMPGGMTGLQLAEQLLKTKPALRVLVSSGYSAELVNMGASGRSGFAYLPKPYTTEALAVAVRKLLDAAAT
jgi:CheY-like chemotaxis protein